MLVPPDNFGLVEEGIYRCNKLDMINFAFLETLKLKSLIYLDAEKPARPLKKFLEENNIKLYYLGGFRIQDYNGHNHVAHGKKDGEISVHAEKNKGESIGKSGKEKSDRFTGDAEGTETAENGRTTSSSSSNEVVDLESTHYSNINTLEKIELNTHIKKDEEWMLIEKPIIQRSFEILLNKFKFNVLIVDSTSTLIGILRKVQKWNFSSIFNEYRLYCSNKANYFAEVFLELIRIELLPYETHSKFKVSSKSTSNPISIVNSNFTISNDSKDGIHNGSNFMENNTALGYSNSRNNTRRNSSSTIYSTSPNTRRSSIPALKESYFGHRRPSFNRLSPPRLRKQSFHDTEYEEEDDEKLISGSPQIPPNLLRLVELRKQHKTTNDDDQDEFNYINESINEETFDADVKSIDSNKSEKLSLNSADSDDVDFNYYKSVNDTQFQQVKIVRVKLPKEDQLPSWFKKGRDKWEDDYRSLNTF